ncbi:MAG: FAD-dependent oxidoreductase [Anaerolineales bacterium]
MHDIIIIGGGPAGLTAIHYALRKRLDALLVGNQLGGKTTYHLELPFNEPAQPILGADIVRQFRAQVEALGFPLHEGTAERIEQADGNFTVHLSDGSQANARSIVIATGAQPVPMGIPGEETFLGRGVSYSSISYAPLFHHRTVAVIGEAKVGLRATAELAAYANQVHLVTAATFDPEWPLVNLLRQHSGVTLHSEATPLAIEGDEYARSLSFERAGETSKLLVDGIFIEQPLRPNTQMVAHLIDLDERGRIEVNERNETSLPGCFAAGDVTATYGEQVVIAIGEGAKAALSAIEYLIHKGHLYPQLTQA